MLSRLTYQLKLGMNVFRIYACVLCRISGVSETVMPVCMPGISASNQFHPSRHYQLPWFRFSTFSLLSAIPCQLDSRILCTPKVALCIERFFQSGHFRELTYRDIRLSGFVLLHASSVLHRGDLYATGVSVLLRLFVHGERTTFVYFGWKSLHGEGFSPVKSTVLTNRYIAIIWRFELIARKKNLPIGGQVKRRWRKRLYFSLRMVRLLLTIASSENLERLLKMGGI